MCGLVGIISSNMMMKHRNAFLEMLYLDTFRGRDSTGVAALRHNADTDVMKSTVPGYEFVENPKVEQHLKLNDFCWIGHNRYGTVGKNIRSNAHPFTVEDEDGCCLLVGAHNGTLKNKWALADHNSYGTDSEAMFNSISKEGLEKTIEKLEGAWAITYYDHYEEELRILRNKERPLFYAYSEDKTTIFWASEIWMIRVTTSRNDIKLFEDKVFSVVEDTLYRIPVPLKHNQHLEIHRKGGLVGKQPSTFFQGDNWWPGKTHQERTAASQSNSKSQSSSTASSVTDSTSGTKKTNDGDKQTAKNESSTKNSSEKTDNVVSIDDGKTYKGYGGTAISKKDLEKQLAGGCSWCGIEQISPDDTYGWLAEKEPVCEKCLDGEHDYEKEVESWFANNEKVKSEKK